MTVLDFIKQAAVMGLSASPAQTMGPKTTSLPKVKSIAKPVKPPKAAKPAMLTPQANSNRLSVMGFGQAPMSRASTAPAAPGTGSSGKFGK